MWVLWRLHPGCPRPLARDSPADRRDNPDRHWRTNRASAYQDYLDDLLDYHEQEAEGILDADAKEPTWREWNIPTLSHTCIQANVNVAVLEPAQDSTFD